MTLIIIFIIAFAVSILGLTIIEYCFGDDAFDLSTMILAALAGSLFLTGCANLWMQHQYEADNNFTQQWLAHPDSHIEVTQDHVILAYAEKARDLKGQEHSYKVTRTIDRNNAHLLGIVEGPGKPLPNYHRLLFFAAGVTAGLLIAKTIRNFIEERYRGKWKIAIPGI
jgi:hypothetical protein